MFDALLCDGADNCDMTIIPVSYKTNSSQLCGYGDATVERGTYLLVWDSKEEEDREWPNLYKFADTLGKTENEYDVFFSYDDDDDTAVWCFKLTSEV